MNIRHGYTVKLCIILKVYNEADRTVLTKIISLSMKKRQTAIDYSFYMIEWSGEIIYFKTVSTTVYSSVDKHLD